MQTPITFQIKYVETTVVNIKTDDYDVLIMRPSKWGNPYSHLKHSVAQYKVNTRREAIDKYREWILNQPALMNSLNELEGKTLGCVCKPKSCHGDVLIDLIKNRKFKSLF